MRTLLMLLALSAAPSAFAQGKTKVGEYLDAVEVDSAQITAAADSLEEQVAPGRGYITAAQATERYQDYVYLFMVGDFETAAEGFFTLVTTAALSDAGLHRDAEWYLAEALFEMGNLSTAEARYQVIADDMQHPFRDDAVRRLLELYASSGQVAAFYALYEQEIVQGRVRPSDVISYAVAKAFYRSDDMPNARKNFNEFQPDSPFYRKARYFLGAIDVKDGELESALPYFIEIGELSVNTLDDREVLDLSLLALGRIYYEQGRFQEAAEIYSRIGGDSEYLADKLYEITWTYIKQEEFKDALRGVEIFLLAYPEHEYAAQLRVLQGHLHMMQSNHDDALSAYEQVIVDYTPIREQFAELAGSSDQPGVYFQRIIDLDSTAGTPEGLPPFAVAMMLSDADLSRSLTVYRELERQRRNVEISEGLITELDKVLGSSAGIGGFDQLRYSVALNQGQGRELMLDLLEIEENWLRSTTGSGQVPKLDALAKTRKETADLLQGAGQQRQLRQQKKQEELQAVREDIEKVQEGIRALGGEADLIRKQLASADTSLTQAEIADAEGRLGDIESELGNMTERVGELKVEEQRVASETSSDDALDSEVAGEIDELRKGYRALRSGATGDDASTVAARIDGLWTALQHDQSRLAQIRERIETNESSEMGRIRTRFNFEVREVAAQRALLDKTILEAQTVSIGLTRAGFGRLEDFFSESVLKADMGVVDVYWAEKLDVADQKSKVQEEKAALLSDLEARFQLIRQKLNQ